MQESLLTQCRDSYVEMEYISNATFGAVFWAHSALDEGDIIRWASILPSILRTYVTP